MDRSQGTAFVTYVDPRDARDAIADYDGQNANGLPIKITLLPTAPAAYPPSSKPGASLFDRIDARPPRSLFDRIDGPRRDDSREDYGRRRRDRSDSPPRKSRTAVPENIDRYVPSSKSRDSRSPARRREVGRRPGARREENGRGGGASGGNGGGRRGRTDEEGRPLIGGRPRKTAEELDAEMEDYWGKPGGADAPKSNGKAETTAAATNGSAAGAAATGQAEDTDMVL